MGEAATENALLLFSIISYKYRTKVLLIEEWEGVNYHAGR